MAEHEGPHEHLDSADDLLNRAEVYQSQRHYGEAAPLFLGVIEAKLQRSATSGCEYQRSPIFVPV